jgi:NADPH-dependent ferric siderophore reductase
VCLEVLRKERVGPHMIRVVLGGSGLVDYANNEFTDRYVKLVLPRPGSTYPDPFDPETIRRTRPEGEWPVLRMYAARSYDAEARELVIDFVHHGDAGVAGPWAAGAEPGDRLYLRGPGGAYAPRADVDWHLLVGDESTIAHLVSRLTVRRGECL